MCRTNPFLNVLTVTGCWRKWCWRSGGHWGQVSVGGWQPQMMICWGNKWQRRHRKKRTHQRSQRPSRPQTFYHSCWVKRKLVIGWWHTGVDISGLWPAEPVMPQQCPSWETVAFSWTLQRLCPRCIVGYTDSQSICLALPILENEGCAVSVGHIRKLCVTRANVASSPSKRRTTDGCSPWNGT